MTKRGPTKAQLALTEAREWIEAAKVEVAECEQTLAEARATLTMHETIYAVLEKAFTRAPKKAAVAKKASKKASKSSRAASLAGAINRTARPLDGSVSKMRCDYRVEDGDPCGEYTDNAIHDKAAGYAGYHEFQPALAQAASGD